MAPLSPQGRSELLHLHRLKRLFHVREMASRVIAPHALFLVFHGGPAAKGLPQLLMVMGASGPQQLFHGGGGGFTASSESSRLYLLPTERRRGPAYLSDRPLNRLPPAVTSPWQRGQPGSASSHSVPWAAPVPAWEMATPAMVAGAIPARAFRFLPSSTAVRRYLPASSMALIARHRRRTGRCEI